MMMRKTTELEEVNELARRIMRWPALRDEPGDERAYELARAVLRLYRDVQSGVAAVSPGLRRMRPLIRSVAETTNGGGLFEEARGLARLLEILRAIDRE